MITRKNSEGKSPEPRRLLAFHYSGPYEQWTPMTGDTEVPALVYEVVEAVEDDGAALYEGRIFDAVTKMLIHERPYQSTILQTFATWWTRETGLEPPPELLRDAANEGNRHGL